MSRKKGYQRRHKGKGRPVPGAPPRVTPAPRSTLLSDALAGLVPVLTREEAIAKALTGPSLRDVVDDEFERVDGLPDAWGLLRDTMYDVGAKLDARAAAAGVERRPADPADVGPLTYDAAGAGPTTRPDGTPWLDGADLSRLTVQQVADLLNEGYPDGVAPTGVYRVSEDGRSVVGPGRIESFTASITLAPDPLVDEVIGRSPLDGITIPDKPARSMPATHGRRRSPLLRGLLGAALMSLALAPAETDPRCTCGRYNTNRACPRHGGDR